MGALSGVLLGAKNAIELGPSMMAPFPQAFSEESVAISRANLLGKSLSIFPKRHLATLEKNAKTVREMRLRGGETRMIDCCCLRPLAALSGCQSSRHNSS